jgi:membrane fusion protein, multidrug efflux system
VDARTDSNAETLADLERTILARLRIRRIIQWSIVAALLVVAGTITHRYWRHAQLYVVTDNAYVNANRIVVSPQVSGRVIAVHVRDQQRVRAGEPLFEVDPASYQLALDEARAQLDLARQSNSRSAAEVTAAQAALAQRHAEQQIAQSNHQRTRDLIAQGFLSKQGAETTASQAETALAAANAAEANLTAARSALGTLGEGNAAVRAAIARMEQAKLDLEHTRVVAEASGVIANFSLWPGWTVQRNAPLFTLIDDREYWVDANFKETELQRVRPGQRASITLDMYPDHPFSGEVQSLSGGTGAAFSLLPAQNASGNWVKVTQRVPVRVRVVESDLAHPLHIGTTAGVEIRVEP